MNFPDPISPIEPPEVDDITAKLSALLDGELDRSELIDVEQFAVDNGTTIDELSADLAASKVAVSHLVADPVPTSTRSVHIGAALDAMEMPEVKSFAAARADRAQRLNNRLRRLTAVAAVFAVVGGIGLLSVQGGFGGSDDEAATSSDDAAESAAMSERNQSADGGASDDGDSLDASAEEAFEEDAAPSEAGETDLAQSVPPEPISVPEAFDLADATLFDLPADVRQRSSIASGSSAPVNEAVCFDAAAELVPQEQIVEGIIIEQAGSEFELVVLINEELFVFELPECVQVD